MPELSVALPISIDPTLLEQFCSRWRIVRLELFGSVLRDDFRPESDVDLLVTFAPDARWGLFAHVEMQDELSALIEHKVDLVSRRAIEQSRNWIRQRAILGSAVPVYVSG
jgi:predicted nucleotidyltransferase